MALTSLVVILALFPLNSSVSFFLFQRQYFVPDAGAFDRAIGIRHCPNSIRSPDPPASSVVSVITVAACLQPDRYVALPDMTQANVTVIGDVMLDRFGVVPAGA